MKTLLKIEELFEGILAIYLFYIAGFAWYLFPLLILIPDIGMVGYLINPKVGSYTYNFAHHKGIAILFYILGSTSSTHTLTLIGIIMFAHSAFDRVLGFGLKHEDNFKNTHLGRL